MLIQLDAMYEDPYTYENGILTFWAVAITDKYVTEPHMKRLYEAMKNTKTLYRHRANATGDGEVHGYIRDAVWLDENKRMKIKVELQSVTDEDKRVLNEVVGSIELAKKYGTKPYGVSVHFQFVELEEGADPLKFHLEEVSITPIPACDECRIITMEMEDVKMGDEQNSIFATTLLENKKMMEKELVTKNATLEELGAKIVEVSAFNDELVEKIKKMEADKAESDRTMAETLKKVDAEKKTLGDKIEYLEKKKPLLDEIKKTERNPVILKIMESQEISMLEEYLKSRPQTQLGAVPKQGDPNVPSVVSMEETAVESKEYKFEDPRLQEVYDKLKTGKRAHGLGGNE